MFWFLCSRIGLENFEKTLQFKVLFSNIYNLFILCVCMVKAKFILSKKKVLEQFDKVNDNCDYVSYSSKTNPIVTGILEENRDCFFSLHLKNELVNVKDKSRVIFLAQGWNLDEIKELVYLGVRWFVVDNEKDLEVLLEFLSGFNGKINLMLRMKLKENTLKTEKYFVFGFLSKRINELISELRGNEKIGKLGIHFHRKTQNIAEWNLKYEFSESIQVDKLDLVCIGGGLPGEYANTNVNVIAGIWKRVGEFREFLLENGVEMMIEPGRFIAAPAGKLITKVLRVYDNNIVVNASVYNSDLDALIVPVKLLVEGEGKGKAYCIKGITPCSMDLFRYRVYLENVREGQELVFLNAGAYNFRSDFCNLEKLETEVVD